AVEIDGLGYLGHQLVKLGRYFGKLALQLDTARFVVADDAVELGSFGGNVRHRSREFGKAFFACRQRLGCDSGALFDAGGASRARLGFARGGLTLGGQARQRSFGVGRLFAFALYISAKLDQVALKLGDALLRTRFLAIKGIAGVGEASQYSG